MCLRQENSLLTPLFQCRNKLCNCILNKHDNKTFHPDNLKLDLLNQLPNVSTLFLTKCFLLVY